MPSHWGDALGTARHCPRGIERDRGTDHSRRRTGNRQHMKQPSTLPVWWAPASALVGLILFTVVFELATKGESILIRPENLVNILRQVSFVGIIAMGMTLVITL